MRVETDPAVLSIDLSANRIGLGLGYAMSRGAGFVFNDSSLKATATSWMLPTDVVLEAVRRHIPEVQHITSTAVVGRETRIYIIDEHIVFKTHQPDIFSEYSSVKREAFFLKYLAEHTDVFTPRVLGEGRIVVTDDLGGFGASGLDYICTTRLPGIPMEKAVIEQSTRAEALYELGQMLRVIHALPTKPFLESGFTLPIADEDSAQGQIQGKLNAVVSRLEGESNRWEFTLPPSAVADLVLSKLPSSLRLAPLHANPGPKHTFVGPLTGEFSGLVNFNEGFLGHPAWDLCAWPQPSDRQAVLAGYISMGPVDDDFMATYLVFSVVADMEAIAIDAPWRDTAIADLEALAAAF